MGRTRQKLKITALASGTEALARLVHSLDAQDSDVDLKSSALGSRPHSEPIFSTQKFLGMGPDSVERLEWVFHLTGLFINLRPSRPIQRRSRGRVKTLVRAPFAPAFVFSLPRSDVPWFTESWTSGSMFPRYPTPKQYRVDEFGTVEQPEAYRVTRTLDVYILLRFLNHRVPRFQQTVEEVLNFIHTRYGGCGSTRGPARLESYLRIGRYADPVYDDVFKPIRWSHTRGASVLLFSQRRPSSRRSAPRSPNAEQGETVDVREAEVADPPSRSDAPTQLVDAPWDADRVLGDSVEDQSPTQQDFEDKGLSPLEKLRRELRDRGSLVE